MINKESNKKKPDDHAVCDAIAHLLIKEKDTGKIIVNQRG